MPSNLGSRLLIYLAQVYPCLSVHVSFRIILLELTGIISHICSTIFISIPHGTTYSLLITRHNHMHSIYL